MRRPRDQPPKIVLAANVVGRATHGGHVSAIAQWERGLRRIGLSVNAVDPGANGGSIAASTGAPVLNVMGSARCEAGRRVAPWIFLDIDPGYPQMWSELGLADLLTGHDAFVSVGANIGRPGCTIPTCGLDWVATPPPVVLADWPVAEGGGGAFTTVATWRNEYGTVSYEGVTYGSRVHEFRKFIELPRLVERPFELALDIHAAEVEDLRALDANGWTLVDPRAVAGSPTTYRAYVQGSRAEFCVAQHMYVATRSGWLSDRSVCYLASGKPVLAQDTGFSEHYPVGEGLLAFSTLEEAAAGVEEIERNYERHCRAARALAEECFDATRVLRSIVALAAAPARGVTA